MKVKPAHEIYFGGPDRSSGYLRDVLAHHIAAVPAGGSIDWVTYYFRDLELARALIQAHNRGVKVTVCLSGKPRVSDANDDVITMLSAPGGLGDRLRTIALPGIPSPRRRAWRPQIHEKLYCFSHPKPVAYIGSFNPSGNRVEERPDLIREIGDQDRGHNMLIGFHDPLLIEQLVKHARQLHQKPPGLFYRFSANANQSIKGIDTTIHFLPSVRIHPVIQFLSQVGKGARVRIAASHIRTNRAVDVMIELAKRGAMVEIIAEQTLRRVTSCVEQRLISAGIRFKRNCDSLPMHLKFILIEYGGQNWSIFGSFNWTKPSFWLNHEIIAISNNFHIFDAFSDRWRVLANEKAITPMTHDRFGLIPV
ncbi:phosphatidylserine/phosphatidylglycerophosphate/cardiolipin synthase family protein [Nitrosomonas sp. Nm33]|uniref:phospholipase D-like domain-containing protein n=1 Tax=Nitrosomonas sp. Nm33 TaxID=133724 RepID=UPI00089AAC1D|nr:phospholipase D-like domain-containing protein [Nitrosomonas sp. Nm33]SDY69879.1 Phosphatidylserine/phosphatidylglycerophosphate/cardiolipin synthase [Nitrosomonas sp. Nm33]